jgi:hypothetical protein
MTGDTQGTHESLSTSSPLKTEKSSGTDLSAAQDCIYDFLLRSVKTLPPDAVLTAFEQLFIEAADCQEEAVAESLVDILRLGDRQRFFYTIKRSCYILINNWGSQRYFDAIKDLVHRLDDFKSVPFSYSQFLDRMQAWVLEFKNSKDFQDLKLFASRYEEGGHWSNRYTSYLLVTQYFDHNNPSEQREAAKEMSRQLRDRFRFDLAMYVAHSQLGSTRSGDPTTSGLNSGILRGGSFQGEAREPVKNPTTLGDNVLRLIKMIVLRRGQFSYEHLARLFRAQTQGITVRAYKKSLVNYLLFSVETPGFVQLLQKQLARRLDGLYVERDGDLIDEAIALRIANRLLEWLLVEEGDRPSPLFNLVLDQGGPLTLVMMLLKIVLVSPKSRNLLELKIATLIRHHEALTATECNWFIQFLEIFSVAFAIYVEDVRYDLVRVRNVNSDKTSSDNGKASKGKEKASGSGGNGSGNGSGHGSGHGSGKSVAGSSNGSGHSKSAAGSSKTGKSSSFNVVNLEDYQIFSQCRMNDRFKLTPTPEDLPLIDPPQEKTGS